MFKDKLSEDVATVLDSMGFGYYSKHTRRFTKTEYNRISSLEDSLNNLLKNFRLLVSALNMEKVPETTVPATYRKKRK